MGALPDTSDQLRRLHGGDFSHYEDPFLHATVERRQAAIAPLEEAVLPNPVQRAEATGLCELRGGSAGCAGSSSGS